MSLFCCGSFCPPVTWLPVVGCLGIATSSRGHLRGKQNLSGGKTVGFGQRGSGEVMIGSHTTCFSEVRVQKIMGLYKCNTWFLK